MYQDHEQLDMINDNLKVWKYMNLSKLIWMLEKRMLWFNRIDSFEDVFEGTYPAANKSLRHEIYEGKPLPDSVYDQIMDLAKKNTFACCFYTNAFESAAMWKLYANDDGVAIQTDTNNLKEAFYPEPTPVFITKVNYIDYDSDFLPERNMFSLGAYKRKSFSHENEIRCLWSPHEMGSLSAKGKGTLISTEKLIKKIYLSPYAPSYLEDVVKGLLVKYTCTSEVVKSPLYTIS